MAINLANNNSLANITALPSSVSGGAMTLLATQTASGSATLSFTSGIDDTYDKYVFKFYNMHPANDGAEFQVNFRDGGTAYDTVKTTTGFLAIHTENDGEAALNDRTASDQMAQNTGFVNLNLNLGNDNDQSLSGQLSLYNPSSTVFTKHFMSTVQYSQNTDGSINYFCAGYGNTTTAIDGVQFKMNSGNFDGVIKLYGIS
jgi:hypothetical protein